MPKERRKQRVGRLRAPGRFRGAISQPGAVKWHFKMESCKKQPNLRARNRQTFCEQYSCGAGRIGTEIETAPCGLTSHVLLGTAALRPYVEGLERWEYQASVDSTLPNCLYII